MNIKLRTPTTMTRDEWEAKYKPGERIDKLADFPLVHLANPATVWTELDCDGAQIIVSGYHYVNREAYYICEVPFDKDDCIEIPDDFEDDEAELDAAAE